MDFDWKLNHINLNTTHKKNAHYFCGINLKKTLRRTRQFDSTTQNLRVYTRVRRGCVKGKCFACVQHQRKHRQAVRQAAAAAAATIFQCVRLSVSNSKHIQLDVGALNCIRFACVCVHLFVCECDCFECMKTAAYLCVCLEREIVNAFALGTHTQLHELSIYTASSMK